MYKWPSCCPSYSSLNSVTASAAGPDRRVPEAIRILAVFLAVVVVVLAVKALPAGLGAVRARTRVALAVGVLAIRLAVVVVVDAVEAQLAALVLDGVDVAVRLRARVALAVGILAIRLAVVVVVLAVKALPAGLGVLGLPLRAKGQGQRDKRRGTVWKEGGGRSEGQRPRDIAGRGSPHCHPTILGPAPARLSFGRRPAHTS
eukprot:COSAG01_NODE_10047_length_2263_cov_52.494917_2_plen_202_part_00